MKLTLEQIKSITLGAVDIWEEDGYVRFSRFYPKQLDIYKEYFYNKEYFYKKAMSTAGVQFRFRTDSQTLSLKVWIEPGASSQLFTIDVFADGNCIGSMENPADGQLGEFSGNFSLGKGEKLVTVYLPWSVIVKLGAMELEAGATLQPVRPAKNLLVYGDSITQGYFAKQNALRYAAQLAKLLDAQEHNRAVGGEIYCAKLAQLEEMENPDYVSIAYGTNDWNTVEQGYFVEQCGQFVKTISEKYPKAQIFVLTPIWRKDLANEKPFGPFEDVEKCIRQCCQGISNAQVIRGFDLVPKESAYFKDEVLHPNDAGFTHYGENLCKAIASLIKK